MLEKEFKYYIDNQAELAKKFSGRYIVIVGSEVVGDYDSELEAYEKEKKNRKIGTFLIQYCSSEKASFTQTYYTHRAAF